jgi:hypothetical protein
MASCGGKVARASIMLPCSSPIFGIKGDSNYAEQVIKRVSKQCADASFNHAVEAVSNMRLYCAPG